jgi:hypothetical protein
MYDNEQIIHDERTIIAIDGRPKVAVDWVPSGNQIRRSKMSIGMILLIVLVLALVGVIPAWPHSNSWGYGPSGGVGLLVIILLVLLLTGRI